MTSEKLLSYRVLRIKDLARQIIQKHIHRQKVRVLLKVI